MSKPAKLTQRDIEQAASHVMFGKRGKYLNVESAARKYKVPKDALEAYLKKIIREDENAESEE